VLLKPGDIALDETREMTQPEADLPVYLVRFDVRLGMLKTIAGAVKLYERLGLPAAVLRALSISVPRREARGPTPEPRDARWAPCAVPAIASPAKLPMVDRITALLIAHTLPARAEALATDHPIRHRAAQRALIGAQFASQISELRHTSKHRALYDRYLSALL
jgi:hypothetical protein